MKWRKRNPKLEYSDFDDIVTQLAAINGIKENQIDEFLNPNESHINDPYLLKNVTQAVDRIYDAVVGCQYISIMADPDCDGLCSSAILFNYISNITKNVTYFYGSRSLGHGLHTVLDKLPEKTELLIVLDSSSSEWKECKQVRDCGIDVIVIDHHLIESKNEHCILVNPQQEGCQYPNKNLSCSALIWQVCRVLDGKFNVDYANDFIDAAAVGVDCRHDVYENAREQSDCQFWII